MEFKKFETSGTKELKASVPAQETTTTDTSTIDRVMRLDPLHMSDQDLDVIIAYYRKARANFETGAKPKRGVNAAGEKVDLSSVMAALTGKPKEEAPKPSSGIRRI